MSAATPSSTAQLLDWLIQQHFLRAAQGGEFRQNPAKYRDAHALAKELVARGWITPYQANQILTGKGKDLVLGEYRLMERLGEGKMGQVFKAWHLRLARVVALKMIHKDLIASTKALERFHREIQTASKLDHPNIVRVRDAAAIEGRPYMVMDYIDGVDLSRLVKSRGPLPVAEAAEFARQAALGLQHALDRGVVHRDIKPGNLILTRGPDMMPLIKILDFGLARFESEREVKNRLTMMGAILGTVDYVAPEQAANAQTADIRADIFSLGCSIFYMLTAMPPYAGASAMEKITARMTDEAPSAKAFRTDIPTALDALLRKMMAQRPELRYQTPLEVALALKPFVGTNNQALQSSLLRLPVGRTPALPQVEPLPDAPTPLSAVPDPLAFSASNLELRLGDLLGKARPDPMSRGTEAFQNLMRNKLFLAICGGGFVLMVLLIGLIVALSVR